MSIRKTLREFVFDDDNKLQIEINRLEKSNRILKNQRGKAYKELKEDYNRLIRKYEDALLELSGFYSDHNVSDAFRHTHYVDSVLSIRDDIYLQIIGLEEKLDKATNMLQSAGLDCCGLVYEKLEKEKKDKIERLRHQLRCVIGDQKKSTEKCKNIQRTLDELEGE